MWTRDESTAEPPPSPAPVETIVERAAQHEQVTIETAPDVPPAPAPEWHSMVETQPSGPAPAEPAQPPAETWAFEPQPLAEVEAFEPQPPAPAWNPAPGPSPWVQVETGTAEPDEQTPTEQDKNTQHG